ncbi:hypothetical protein ACVIJW_001124 [Bradyrhizobium barranii subsp. barranii]
MPPKLVRWTVGHNIRTIDPYRPKARELVHVAAGRRHVRQPFRQRRMEETATLQETPVHSPGPYSVRHINRNNQC